ncbi:MAG: plastocyanin/azurin family copper-binding protein [Candidatus Binatia bacterium]
MASNRMAVLAAGCVALSAYLWGMAAPAAASDIVKGTVVLPRDSGSVRNVVVYLEGAIGTPMPSTVVIDQKGLKFVPHVVAIVKGSTVKFLNSDPVFHNVYSSSATKRFDLGMFAQGESRNVTFDTPGVVELRCAVHPKMQGFVLVLENNYFTTPDERGDFQIGGVPRGRYKLRAWHEALPAVETWVNLEEAKLRDIELRFHR